MGYTNYIWDNAIKYNISPSIIAAVIETESSGNPKAIRQEPAIKDYSLGLMQVLTGTAKYVKTLFPQIAYTGNPAELNDPKINIEVGTAYLRYQLDRYTKTPVIKPITDMIAAYNAGTARRNSTADFVYVNSKGSTIVQSYVDKVVDREYRYQMFFVYLYGYDTYQAKFPSSYWSFNK
jgi:soluble lytic murein transglycosylase-like protein